MLRHVARAHLCPLANNNFTSAVYDQHLPDLMAWRSRPTSYKHTLVHESSLRLLLPGLSVLQLQEHLLLTCPIHFLRPRPIHHLHRCRGFARLLRSESGNPPKAGTAIDRRRSSTMIGSCGGAALNRQRSSWRCRRHLLGPECFLMLVGLLPLFEQFPLHKIR